VTTFIQQPGERDTMPDTRMSPARKIPLGAMISIVDRTHFVILNEKLKAVRVVSRPGSRFGLPFKKAEREAGHACAAFPY
jgi:hypothetical protein